MKRIRNSKIADIDTEFWYELKPPQVDNLGPVVTFAPVDDDHATTEDWLEEIRQAMEERSQRLVDPMYTVVVTIEDVDGTPCFIRYAMKRFTIIK